MALTYPVGCYLIGQRREHRSMAVVPSVAAMLLVPNADDVSAGVDG